MKISTTLGKLKLSLKSYNEARITIEAMLKKKAWLVVAAEKKQETSIYTGVFDKISKEKEKIAVQGEQVGQSFASFDQLFGNLREIKRIMSEMKAQSGQSDGDNPEVNRILKDMGFVSVISRDEEGKDYYHKLATNLYEVCQTTLFKNFGGMVALLDLYYFYNKKRQMSLLSPEELLKACELFPSLGFSARVVHYPNNIVLLESTTFDAAADFEQNFAKYFTDYVTGYSSEEIARKKGLPVAIVDIKLANACRAGKLAASDRIEGLKYYKNLLLTI